MQRARVSIGNTSLAVRYAALAPAEAKKNTIAPISVSVLASRLPSMKPVIAEQHAGEDVGAGDHPDAAYPVEERAEEQRAEEVADREDGEVVAGLADPEEGLRVSP